MNGGKGVAIGFSVMRCDSRSLAFSKGYANSWYINRMAIASETGEREAVESTYRHTSRVEINICELDDMLERTGNEELYSAGLWHDIGRNREMPHDWSQGYGIWRKECGEKHHIFSVEDSQPYLVKSGYEPDEIVRIGQIILHHRGHDVNNDSPYELKLIVLADKLDKLREAGVTRLVANMRRFSPDKNQQKILEDVKGKVKEAYTKCQNLGMARDLSEKLYQESMEKIDELKVL